METREKAMDPEEIIANEVIKVDDHACLSGRNEVVGPYLDMVCQSTGPGYEEPVVFLIFEPESDRFLGIIKIIYDQMGRRKYLLFSGFPGLLPQNLHFIIKELNSRPYDFKFFKVREGPLCPSPAKTVAVTKFIGVSYFRYQQLLASDQQGKFEFLEDAADGLIG